MRRRLLVPLALVLLSCAGARSPEGDCLGYACDEGGAKSMFWETTDAAFEPSDVARGHLEEAFSKSLDKMAKEKGFTPDGFELARGNLKRFLGEVPDGADALAAQSEELKKGTLRLCPLWPFC